MQCIVTVVTMTQCGDKGNEWFISLTQRNLLKALQFKLISRNKLFLCWYVYLRKESMDGALGFVCLSRCKQSGQLSSWHQIRSNVDQQLNNDNIKIVDFLVSSQRETSRDSALENAHLYFKNTCDLLRGQLFCSTKYPNIST